MKKLVYLFLTVLIVACSSSDDDGNSGVSITDAQFVGSWLTEFDDEDGGSLILEFNADGTGSENEVYDDETYTEVFSWSTTSTLMTITYALDDGFVAEYEFITDDQVKFTINEDDEAYEVVFDRVID